MSRRPLSLPRKLAFSLIVLVAFFAVANGLIERAEEEGLVDTHRREDRTQFVESELFVQAGDTWTNTLYGEEGMFRMRFAAEKGDGWRMFVVGASFAQGTPFACCAHDGGTLPGATSSRLQARLEALYEDRPLEVLSATTGGAASGRVAQVAEQVVGLQTDALLVMTCNNEGALSHSAVREQLHKLGGYRFLNTVIAGEPDDAGRSYYTPQYAAVGDARADFERNLRRILDAAAERGVTVLLATLPVNMRYEGFERGHTSVPDAEPYETRADDLPRGFFDAMNAMEAGELDHSAAILDAMAPDFPEYYGLRGQVRVAGGDVDGGVADLRRYWGDCLGDAFDAYHHRRYEQARDLFARCEELPQVVRYRGLVEFQLGEHEAARRWLTQSVELSPSNRCRPSFNRLIRDLASERRAAGEDVVLVDLEAAAERASPGTLPGPELFVDYCHMNERGYALMADEIVRTLREHEVGLDRPRAGPAPRDEAGRADRLGSGEDAP